MALGTITFTAELNPTGKWALLTLTCTGMTRATIYRMTPDGPQAVRGAFDIEALGAANVADYEAPQNTPLTYFARVTDGTMTQDSLTAAVAGVVDRGGDVLFGMTNPLAPVPIYVVSFPALTSGVRQSSVDVIGRADPVVISDVRQYPSGTLTVATLDEGTRLAMNQILADGGVVAFSPHQPTFGFSDVWYFSVGNAVEQRLSPIGEMPERKFILEVQRISPPPADFVGPAFQTWQAVYDAGTTWNDWAISGKTWLQVQVV